MAKMNPVVHFEMGYDDPARMAKFYETAFGWKTQQMGEDMGGYITAQTTETDANRMVQTKGAINGGFYKKTDNPLSQAPSVVISVDDIKLAVQAVKDAGGTILGSMTPEGERSMEPQMIPGVGLWVSAQDTEGNRFSILQANN
ncbi:MAG TPA: VOC family protein [Candidatus Saccharimonadales bacterium]|nr:VOC family protein [Candidatus Saccharimonadales bacterium]